MFHTYRLVLAATHPTVEEARDWARWASGRKPNRDGEQYKIFVERDGELVEYDPNAPVAVPVVEAAVVESPPAVEATPALALEPPSPPSPPTPVEETPPPAPEVLLEPVEEFVDEPFDLSDVDDSSSLATLERIRQDELLRAREGAFS